MLTDLLAGQVQAAVDNLPASIGHIRAGKLRALAVTTALRSQTLPDVPDRGRLRSGLRGHLAVRRRCAEGSAGRDHRQAQQRDQRSARGSEAQDAAARARRHAASRLARRFRQARRRRHREVGQGDPGRQHQDGVRAGLGPHSITFRSAYDARPRVSINSVAIRARRHAARRSGVAGANS